MDVFCHLSWHPCLCTRMRSCVRVRVCVWPYVWRICVLLRGMWSLVAICQAGGHRPPLCCAISNRVSFDITFPVAPRPRRHLPSFFQRAFSRVPTCDGVSHVTRRRAPAEKYSLRFHKMNAEFPSEAHKNGKEISVFFFFYRSSRWAQTHLLACVITPQPPQKASNRYTTEMLSLVWFFFRLFLYKLFTSWFSDTGIISSSVFAFQGLLQV